MNCDMGISGHFFNNIIYEVPIHLVSGSLLDLELHISEWIWRAICLKRKNLEGKEGAPTICFAIMTDQTWDLDEFCRFAFGWSAM